MKKKFYNFVLQSYLLRKISIKCIILGFSIISFWIDTEDILVKLLYFYWLNRITMHFLFQYTMSSASKNTKWKYGQLRLLEHNEI